MTPRRPPYLKLARIHGVLVTVRVERPGTSKPPAPWQPTGEPLAAGCV